MLNNENTSDTLPDSTVNNISSFMTGSNFADSVIVLPDAPVQSFAQRRLNTLFETELSLIEEYTDEHWKTPEFPLARIKKIMRIDEDVKMISGEVPVLLSKAIELFVTELTLRSWMLTEDSKRRTVQRSDIAMAIAKNDMFDFLIDIVPREEINSRNRSDSSSQSSMLSPELIQLYLQLLSQQNDTQVSLVTSTSKKGDTSDVEQNSQSAVQHALATNAILQQQIQLIQQIAQLQQQISKTPPTPALQSPAIFTNSTPTTDQSPIYSSQSAQNSKFVSTTTVSSHSGMQNHGTFAIGTPSVSIASSDLLASNTLAPVTPFLSELTASQFSSSPVSTSTVPELTGPNVQRYVINPGGFVEHSGLHATASKIGQTSLPLVSLQNVSSGDFASEISFSNNEQKE